MDELFGNWITLKFWIDLFPAAIVGALVVIALQKLKVAFFNFSKYLKMRELKKIKVKRFNYADVNYAIVKAHSLMVLFFGSALFAIFHFSAHASLEGHWLIVIIKSLPVYIIEVMYLIQRDFTKKLVKSVRKIHINKQ
ncbi:hypothetical protein tloyanaT_32080 [Thalassotalea loyana]|uniref:DUF4282 domain-containing protein n=1 Tax=Thalassotalea loyana TaxID=280483 RepID=A0ABQ6HFT6_9GAMM|nr:hypothetical protein [Thalassotalea loyana]GLX86955.1 hypothetical protein tloyanaT_32080 [Thalassotalea loyana]